MSSIWLRYRDDFVNPNVNFRIDFELEKIAQLADGKREYTRATGEDKLQDAISFFASKLGKIANRDDYEKEIEKAAAELCVVVFLRATEYQNLTYELLENATIECASDTNTGATSLHIALQNNPFDLRKMSFSVELDSFFAAQKTAQAASITELGMKGRVIDDLGQLYKVLVQHLSEAPKPDPLLVTLALSIRQDLAPACAMALGGRPDPAYAIARRALEISGVARIISNDEKAAQIWISAHESASDWSAFKKVFTVKKYFPDKDPFWDEVYKTYDFLARMHHPNPHSFVRADWSEIEGQKLRINVHQLELQDEGQIDKPALKSMWFVLDCFALTLRAFERTQRGIWSQDPNYDFHHQIIECSSEIKKLLNDYDE